MFLLFAEKTIQIFSEFKSMEEKVHGYWNVKITCATECRYLYNHRTSVVCRSKTKQECISVNVKNKLEGANTSP